MPRHPTIFSGAGIGVCRCPGHTPWRFRLSSFTRGTQLPPSRHPPLRPSAVPVPAGTGCTASPLSPPPPAPAARPAARSATAGARGVRIRRGGQATPARERGRRCRRAALVLARCHCSKPCCSSTRLLQYHGLSCSPCCRWPTRRRGKAAPRVHRQPSPTQRRPPRRCRQPESLPRLRPRRRCRRRRHQQQRRCRRCRRQCQPPRASPLQRRLSNSLAGRRCRAAEHLEASRCLGHCDSGHHTYRVG